MAADLGAIHLALVATDGARSRHSDAVLEQVAIASLRRGADVTLISNCDDPTIFGLRYLRPAHLQPAARTRPATVSITVHHREPPTTSAEALLPAHRWIAYIHDVAAHHLDRAIRSALAATYDAVIAAPADGGGATAVIAAGGRCPLRTRVGAADALIEAIRLLTHGPGSTRR